MGIEEKGLAHLRQELAGGTTQLAAISESMLEILAGVEQGELLGHILASAGACVPSADSGLVALAEEGGRSLEIGASYGFDFDELEKSAWLKMLSLHAVASAKAGHQVRVDSPALPAGRRAVVAVPLEGDGRSLGLVALFSIFPEAFTPPDSEALGRFAAVAALGVCDAGLRAEIASLSVTDSLTGLLNQKGFNDVADREFKRACRFGEPLAVLRVELDGLKVINDRYGRSVGDQLLRGLARRLQQQLRAVDLIGRLGPGRFLVMLPGTTAGKAAWVASRMRRALMDAPYETRRGEMKIEVSTGTASLDKGCANVAQLIDWADLSLLKRI